MDSRQVAFRGDLQVALPASGGDNAALGRHTQGSARHPVSLAPSQGDSYSPHSLRCANIAGGLPSRRPIVAGSRRSPLTTWEVNSHLVGLPAS